MVDGDDLFVPKILGQTDPIPSKTLIFNRFSTVASACQPYNTLRKFKKCAIIRKSNELKMNIRTL